MTTTIQDFDYTVDVLQAILWEYNESSNLIALLNAKQDWYTTNQQVFWGDWFDNVFNLLTADEFGIAVWSIILGIPVFYISPDPPNFNQPTFGFNEVTAFPTLLNTNQNFTRGNFLAVNTETSLTLEEQRVVLRLRLYQLISRGAIADFPLNDEYVTTPYNINAMLADVFSTLGDCWVIDNLDMSMTYVFDFDLSNGLRDVLIEYDLLPRPAGVLLNYLALPDNIFGFGAFNQNFQNGNFVTPFT